MSNAFFLHRRQFLKSHYKQKEGKKEGTDVLQTAVLRSHLGQVVISPHRQDTEPRWFSFLLSNEVVIYTSDTKPMQLSAW